MINTKQNNQTVTCVFDRDLDDYDKSQLIRIFETPEHALQYIKEANNIDLFWETWEITNRRKGSA